MVSRLTFSRPQENQIFFRLFFVPVKKKKF